MQRVKWGITEADIRFATDRNRIITEEEHRERFFASVEYMILRARIVASSVALSYRNFVVGCAAFAYNKDAYYLGHRWKIFFGSNIKLDEGSPKICAEPIVIQSARAARYQRIIGLVVVGEPQEDDSGVTPVTLHPCAVCRKFFLSVPEVTGETIIVTAHLEKDDSIEVLTVNELLRIHSS